MSYLSKACEILEIIKNKHNKINSEELIILYSEFIETAVNLMDNEDIDELLKNSLVEKVRIFKLSIEAEKKIITEKLMEQLENDGDKRIRRTMVASSQVKFSDIIGQKNAVRSLQMAILLPSKFPSLFSKENKYSGFLLYGVSKIGLIKSICKTNNFFFSASRNRENIFR